jgi:hypothetical protein
MPTDLVRIDRASRAFALRFAWQPFPFCFPLCFPFVSLSFPFVSLSTLARARAVQSAASASQSAHRSAPAERMTAAVCPQPSRVAPTRKRVALVVGFVVPQCCLVHIAVCRHLLEKRTSLAEFLEAQQPDPKAAEIHAVRTHARARTHAHACTTHAHTLTLTLTHARSRIDVQPDVKAARFTD